MTTTSHHRTALLVIILVKNVTCRKCITWRRNNYKCISGTVFSKKSDGRLHHMMRTLRYQVHSLCKTTLDLCFKHTYNNWLKHAVAILVFAASIVIYIYIYHIHTHPPTHIHTVSETGTGIRPSCNNMFITPGIIFNKVSTDTHLQRLTSDSQSHR